MKEMRLRLMKFVIHTKLSIANLNGAGNLHTRCLLIIHENCQTHEGDIRFNMKFGTYT